MVIPIVIGAVVTNLKEQDKRHEQQEIRGRIKMIQTTALLRSAEILSNHSNWCENFTRDNNNDIHWKICKFYGIPKTEKGHKHQPEPIQETKEATLLRDFVILIDRKIKSN